MTTNAHHDTHETFKLGEFTVPRLWTGLWQLSSNAWGTAPVSKIRLAMGRYVESGYMAFADHYGSAELIFGQFRASLESPSSILGATKYCVFKPVEISRDTVEAVVRERMERMRTEKVDLLQFHWQDYANLDYIRAIEILSDLKTEGLIAAIGLCNFDALHTDEICARFPGTVVSNQIPFSVVDTRALYAMADVCAKHGLKLLTYGTLCGGFLADKWIGAVEPDPYSGSLNPSQRKYLDLILKAWGSWALFQELLVVLRGIGQRHSGASVSNVATRWVLDHPAVGAVIVGARLGCTEYPADNLKVYSLVLTATDHTEIEEVLARSAGRHLIETIGDVGAEYR
ncbi:NADP-dependent oxidoreductase domain-containing protein [Mycena olivaceomarginata]|nr:NADP-dependent oxidoreductase domain-containing protein [Mycena olivaceomarginata]